MGFVMAGWMASTDLGGEAGSWVLVFVMASPIQSHSLVSLFCSQFHAASFAKLTDTVNAGKITRNKRRSIDGIKFSSVLDH